MVKVSIDEIKQRVAEWEAAHPGYNMDNYYEYWRDPETGEVDCSPDEHADAAALSAIAKRLEL